MTHDRDAHTVAEAKDLAKVSVRADLDGIEAAIAAVVKKDGFYTR